MNERIEKFEIKEDFYLNGEKFKIISGSIHYFRIVPEYWEDRLLKLKAMGCNSVESYVPWNLVNPKPEVFDFEGILNLRRFIELAEKIGLYFILRPGPYICAEWEFGGQPAWLLKDPKMSLRTNYPPYVNACEKYLIEVVNRVKDKQITHGGNILMVQIENEYGYYGDDKEYLSAIKNILINNGINVPLITSDGPWNEAYMKGALDFDEVLPTFNFGSSASEHYNIVKKNLGNKPFMCMEFWIGWFDYWGGKHADRSAVSVKKDLEDLLSIGHVNFFMFSGGTNFGFTNGANDGVHSSNVNQKVLQPDVTSYDYDGILTEAGDLTEKYYACKDVISKYVSIPSVTIKESKKLVYGKVELSGRVSLFNVIDDIAVKRNLKNPVSMEYLDQNFGYIMYRTVIKVPGVRKIDLIRTADRVHYFVDEKLNDIRYDSSISIGKRIEFTHENTKLDFLVENMGRVNFGNNMNFQHKGIAGGVLIDGALHQGFEIYPLDFDDLSNLDFTKGYQEGTPSFSRFEFVVDECCDTFLKLDGFGKGFVIVNGYNVGRYFHVGPQKTLYIPAPLLLKGTNEIIVFESDGKVNTYIEFLDKHILG